MKHCKKRVASAKKELNYFLAFTFYRGLFNAADLCEAPEVEVVLISVTQHAN